MRITLEPIGRVASEVTAQTDAGWGKTTARILLEPAYAAGLRGLCDFSHVLVLTWLHQAAFDPERHLVRRPRGRRDMPEVGIFAQRAKDRPNPIGIAAVRILGVEGNTLTVQGLDAVDGTPVLDLKPYYPAYDLKGEAHTPEWVDQLMMDYF